MLVYLLCVCEMLIESRRGESDLLESWSGMIVMSLVGAGNQMQVLCTSIKCLLPLSCDSRLHVEEFYYSII